MKFRLVYMINIIVIAVASLQNSYAGYAPSRAPQAQTQNQASLFDMLRELYNNYTTQQATGQPQKTQSTTAGEPAQPTLFSKIIDAYHQMQLEQQAKQPGATGSYGAQTANNQQQQDLSSSLKQALLTYLATQSNKQGQYPQPQKDVNPQVQPSLLSKILSQLSGGQTDTTVNQ